jgi:hypothetical protein
MILVADCVGFATVQLFIQADAAFETVLELGSLSCLQFVDLNAKLSAFQRHYSHDVKRAEELERRIRFLETVLAEQKFKLSKQELNEAVEMTELSTLELLEARVRQFAIFFFFFFFFSSGFFCFFCL